MVRSRGRLGKVRGKGPCLAGLPQPFLHCREGASSFIYPKDSFACPELAVGFLCLFSWVKQEEVAKVVLRFSLSLASW